jgi:hypothetical protein
VNDLAAKIAGKSAPESAPPSIGNLKS